MGGAPVSGQGSGTLGLSGSCGQGPSARTASGTSSPFGGGIRNPTSGTGILLGSSEVETPGISPVITSPVASTLPGFGTLGPPVSSTLVIPGQPTGPSRYYGFSTAAGSGGLVTAAVIFSLWEQAPPRAQAGWQPRQLIVRALVTAPARV